MGLKGEKLHQQARHRSQRQRLRRPPWWSSGQDLAFQDRRRRPSRTGGAGLPGQGAQAFQGRGRRPSRAGAQAFQGRGHRPSRAGGAGLPVQGAQGFQGRGCTPSRAGGIGLPGQGAQGFQGRGTGLIPGWGAQIPHATWHGQKISH